MVHQQTRKTLSLSRLQIRGTCSSRERITQNTTMETCLFLLFLTYPGQEEQK